MSARSVVCLVEIQTEVLGVRVERTARLMGAISKMTGPGRSWEIGRELALSTDQGEARQADRATLRPVDGSGLFCLRPERAEKALARRAKDRSPCI